MFTRVKVFMIIVGIIAVITVTTVWASFVFIRNSLEQTVESSIISVCEVADALVADEIYLLKAKASATARNLQNSPEEGTGPGLSIAARTAELMDGAISVTSEYGKGSTTAFIRQQCASNEILGRDMAEILSKLQYFNKKRINF
jgi:signal transduction histidine kinase